jgi:thiol-disulfide isomerase/thioredoxin
MWSILLFLAALLPVDESGYQKLTAAHKGKVVLYNFWATYCVPCRAEMPELLKLRDRLQARGFELVLISADEPEQEASAEKLLKQRGFTGVSYRRQAKNDDAFVNALDPKWNGGLPASFLYDRNGKKVRSWIGQADIKELEAAIGKLL